MTRFDYLWRKFCERTDENTELNHLLLAHMLEEELKRERLEHAAWPSSTRPA